MQTLYLIGHPEDPYALWLTDYEAPVDWSLYGIFQPAVVKRGTVSSKIGLEVTSLDITYSPKTPRTFGVTVATANPMQFAQQGFYDNWPVYVWTVFMPTPGDANTLGCCELFGGRVATTTVDRTGIKWQVESFLNVVNLDVPPNMIEMTNALASFLGAQPPTGFANVPQFVIVAGGGIFNSPSEFFATSSNYPGQTWSNNTFANGFVVFTSGSLSGYWSAIGSSGHYQPVSTDYNQFNVYTPFPWAPAPGDTFYVSTKFPTDQSETTVYKGFPYVPDPTQAL